MFFVFEGIDGSGTTTQAQLLYNTFRSKNIPALLTAQPSTGSIGKYIRTLLQQETETLCPKALQFLFLADRQQHLTSTILPALAEGKIVICDRYSLSTTAYAERDDNGEFFHALSASFPSPDITFFLDIPANIALERITARNESREIFEKQDSLSRIAAAYSIFFKKNTSEKKYRLNGAESIDQLSEKIRNISLAHMHT